MSKNTILAEVFLTIGILAIVVLAFILILRFANCCMTSNDEELQVDEAGVALPKSVHDMAQKATGSCDNPSSYKTMFKKSELYFYLVLMMGIFYSIPALQLAFSYQQQLLSTGDQDLCYYNFLCSIPMLNIADMNHIFSNAFYVFFGLIFLVITIRKQRDFMERMKQQSQPKGIPEHYGIYYAMGWALVFEGVLSACYHICPTNVNFQFDTAFMYVIALLCFLKLYQLRHPDVTSSAYKVFLGVGMVMLMEIVGVFWSGPAFWITSLVMYALAMIVLSVVLYHSGRWELNPRGIRRMFRVCCKFMASCESKHFTRHDFVLVVTMNVVNGAFLIYGAVVQPSTPSYLLMIFITNLMTYCVYYITLKFYHKEKIGWQPIVYGLLGCACWIPALYFYKVKQRWMGGSPAESKNFNAECSLLSMFDYHDIWHMFSAGGLFFSFMLILTLDDALRNIPRNRINVF